MKGKMMRMLMRYLPWRIKIKLWLRWLEIRRRVHRVTGAVLFGLRRTRWDQRRRGRRWATRTGRGVGVGRNLGMEMGRRSQQRRKPGLLAVLERFLLPWHMKTRTRERAWA